MDLISVTIMVSMDSNDVWDYLYWQEISIHSVIRSKKKKINESEEKATKKRLKNE